MISILNVEKNHSFLCPKDCVNVEIPPCNVKKTLMNKPLKEKLVSSIIVAEITSFISPPKKAN